MRCERPQPEHRLGHLGRQLGALTQYTSDTSAALRRPQTSRLHNSGFTLRPAFFNPALPAFTQHSSTSIQSQSEQSRCHSAVNQFGESDFSPLCPQTYKGLTMKINPAACSPSPALLLLHHQLIISAL